MEAASTGMEATVARSAVAATGMRRSASGRTRTTQTRPTRSCTPMRSKGKVNP